MTPIQRQIYQLVKRRPRTVEELVSLIWWIHPQDAPHRSNIKAHVWAINRQLEGERIRGEWGGACDGTRRDWGQYTWEKVPIADTKKKPEISKNNETRKKTWYLKKRGIIAEPKACERCKIIPNRPIRVFRRGGKGRQISGLHAHHPDYDKPNQVIWLCQACHTLEHKKRPRDLYVGPCLSMAHYSWSKKRFIP